MPTAEQVATSLAYEFLKRGNYSAASGSTEVRHLVQAAAIADEVAEDVMEGEPAFASLAVQSVGFEEGSGHERVHIYLTKASSKMVQAVHREVEGIEIVAHKMGAISVRPEAAGTSTNRGNFYQRQARVCCGSSCAPTSENCSGTLGALVRQPGHQQIFVLSNNHVLAGCNHVPPNQPVMSPSANDSRADSPAPVEIGRHFRIHDLRSGDPNFVNPCDTDLAIARATHPNRISSWQGDDATGYDTPANAAEPLSLIRVKKIGRTTGLTTGEIEAKVTTPMPVAYTSKHFKGMVWFQNVWTIRGDGGNAFALPGDSGSLVVAEDGTSAFGVVFAASKSGEYAWMIPMPCVIGSFGGLELVTGHGV